MQKPDNKIIPSWKWIRLADILKTSSGGTPNTSVKEYWENGTIPWINSGGLKDDIITQPTTYITKEGLLHSSARLFPKNTILIALTGATLGRVGLLDIDCSTNQSVTGIYPSKYILPKYLFYYFLYIRTRLLSQAKGSAQPHINKGIIDNTKIPLAPPSHQKELVSLLDELTENANNLRNRSNELKILEDSVFKSFIYNDDDFYPPINLGQFCTERSERVGDKWSSFRLVGVSKDNGVSNLRLSGKASYEKYKKVHPGDFLYNPMRVNIGSIAIYTGPELAITSPDYVVFTVNHSLSPLILLNYLKSNLGIAQINNHTQGSVRSRLYFSSLAKIEIPFCGAEEHIEAQNILESFQKMKHESDMMLNGLSKTFEYAFQKAFTGKQFENVKADIDVETLETLLITELDTINLKQVELTRTPKTKKKMPKKSPINILTIIKNEFGREPFTFDNLLNLANLPYEQLKDEIFEMIDKKIILNFNTQEEKMYLKLLADENFKD